MIPSSIVIDQLTRNFQHNEPEEVDLPMYEGNSIKSPPPLSGWLRDPPKVLAITLGIPPRVFLAPLKPAGGHPGGEGAET